MDSSTHPPSLSPVRTENTPQHQHLTLTGEPFTLPSFTMAQIHAAIPPHCFRPSTLRSLAYVARDLLYMCTLAYLATTYIPLLPSPPLRALAWAAYTTLQGFVFTGIWILAHECGHGAFSKSKTLNWTVGLVLHSFLLVPFHSWRISHSQHHKATGNMDRDTAFVPHTRASWLERNFGAAASEHMVEFAELAEDAPVVSLWNAFVHQAVGWPGYLMANLTGQEYGGVKGVRLSHFYFGEDSVFFKKGELALVALSDVGVAVMIAALVWAGQVWGSWEVIVLWGIPWLWVNNWIVAITFLQHTDGQLPHYTSSTWTFARGATATIDRDLGFIDTHLFHDIIGTHVCHHLVSTIPFYRAGEASVHIRKVMGKDYKADTTTPFWTAFWRNQRTCKFVEESAGREGEGVFMFRNLYARAGEAAPADRTGGAAEAARAERKNETRGEGTELKRENVKPSAMQTAMSSGRNLDARRRLSQSAQLSAKLPLLAEA